MVRNQPFWVTNLIINYNFKFSFSIEINSVYEVFGVLDLAEKVKTYHFALLSDQPLIFLDKFLTGRLVL